MAADPWLLASLVTVHGGLWTLGHCAGMCGPLLHGLPITRPGGPGVRDLLAYQGGKAVTYAALGAMAGAAGGGVHAMLGRWAPVLLLLVALGLLWRGAVPFPGLSAVVRRWAPTPPGPRRAAVLGLILAVLPCGVVLWALGLAALAGDPWIGAALMAWLTVVATPVLLLLHGLGSPLRRWPGAARTLPILAALTLGLAAWQAWRAGCA